MNPSPPHSTVPTPPLSLGKKLAFSLAAVLLVLGLAETTLRLSGFSRAPREKTLWIPTVAGFQGTFEFHIPTHLAPPGYFWLSEPNTPYTDRFGFRLPELADSKPEGKIRIAFLGGSTTQGGYRPYPERAVAILNAALGEDRYEALNAACSSYSTHQSLIALRRLVLDRQPDVVCIYHGWNDALIQEDGYRDDAKDAAANSSAGASSLPSPLASLRLARLAGFWLDSLRRPEPRVPPDRFRANLEALAAACGQRSIRTVLFTRPPSNDSPLPETAAPMARHYAARFNSPDPARWLSLLHREIVDVQRGVAANTGAELFDASHIVRDLESRRRRGEFGPGIRVYAADGLHATPFAEQWLAERLAIHLAPDHAARIEAHLASPAYLAEQARIALQDLLPFDAAFYARRAIAAEPSQADAISPLLAQAENLFEFALLFEDGRWGGFDPVFESKINKLRRCLEIRPDDFGVLLQIFRVCFYSARPDLAAPAMRGFRPANRDDFLRWKSMELESHAAARRRESAAQTLRDVLQVDPENSRALSMLRSLEAASD